MPKLTPLSCIIRCVPGSDGAESPCPMELSPDPVSPGPWACRPPHATGARPSPTAPGIVTPRGHLGSFSQLLLEPAVRGWAVTVPFGGSRCRFPLTHGAHRIGAALATSGTHRLGAFARADAIASAAQVGKVMVFGLPQVSVLPRSIPGCLGLPLQLSFSREKGKKGEERERATQSSFWEQTGPHPAYQRGRKSNKGPRPGSTAPLAGGGSAHGDTRPRDRVLVLAQNRGVGWGGMG